MKTANIPATVVVKSGTFKGTYERRPGSKRDKDLYCWFNTADASMPHISIDMSYMHENFQYFHVTFDVYKGANQSGDVLERASYSIHFVIDRETDVVSPVPRRTTDARRWNVPDMKTEGSALGFADMDRKAVEVAKEFYSAAFMQSL